MTKRNGIIAVCVVLVLVIGGIAGYSYYKRTPSYTLTLIRESLEKHDWDAFSKHVDTENIIGIGYDALLEGALEADDGTDENIKKMAVGFAKTLKPGIVSALNEEVKEWVKTGKFQSSDSKENKKSQVDADDLKNKFDVKDAKYKGIAYKKTEGDFAIVGITIADNQLGKDFTLDLKMRQLDDGTWQVMEISNLKEYFLEYDKACKEKLEKLNKPIQAELDSRVNITDVKASIVRDDFGLSDFIQFKVAMTISSDTPIATINGNFYLKNSNGRKMKIPFTINTSGASGNKVYNVGKELNPFISQENELQKTGLKGVTITTQLTKLEYTDGTSLELKTSLDNDK